jgi:hypothetical protein
VTAADVGLSEVLRGKVVRHVLLALSRFGPRVRRVKVSLTEPPNPLGGIDQLCQMRAWLLESDDIRAEAINGGVETAVARAAAQLAKRVDAALVDGSDGAAAPPGGAPRAPRRRQRQPALSPRSRKRSA